MTTPLEAVLLVAVALLAIALLGACGAASDLRQERDELFQELVRAGGRRRQRKRWGGRLTKYGDPEEVE